MKLSSKKISLMVLALVSIIIVAVAVLFASGTIPAGTDQANNTGYVGLSEQAALDKAEGEHKAARVVERDGESLAVTMDFSAGRLNLYIKDGKVYKVVVEGE